MLNKLCNEATPAYQLALPHLKAHASGYMKHLKLYTETVEHLILILKGGKLMTVYEELIKRVEEGESFYVNFKNRSLKIGNKFVITDGLYDKERILYDTFYNSNA